MSDTIGQRLKKERESRYLTLEKASEATRIRVVFLHALESDDYSTLPSAAQGRGFLRNYADYLGLNLDEMIADIQKNAPPVEVSGPLPEVNLAETESPVLNLDDESARLVWMNKIRAAWSSLISRFERRAQVESAPREAGTEIQPEVEQQPVVADESNVPVWRGWIQKIVALIPSRSAGPAIESNLEPEPVSVAEELPAPAVPVEALLPADQIFKEIGVELRERRELISLTVDEVERHTKLRVALIKALEAGEQDKLPSPVQTRGMLANYANFLDMDVDRVLLRFADALQARRHEKYAEIPRERVQTEVKPTIPMLRGFIAGDLIFGVTIIVALAGLAVWGVGRVISSQDTPIEPTAPSIADVLSGNLPTPSPVVGMTFLPVDEGIATPTLAELLVEESPTLASTANVTVDIFALERVFVRISVDGEVAFEGRLAPLETRFFEANDQVVVLTGNAAVLRIIYNGNDLGLMGNTGEVVSRVYLVTGVATPTATLSPTPTNTLSATMTPTPTQTPTFTPPSP